MGTMNLKDYLDNSTPYKEKNIRAILTRLANTGPLCRRMITNLFAESSFTVRDWDELFLLLKENRSVEKLKGAITEFCQRGRSLKGNPAKISAGHSLGRVVSFNKFCYMLVKLKYYSDFEEARADIRYRIDLDAKIMDSKWKSQKLGRYIMWSTFDPKRNNPFRKSMNVDNLICSLGLTPITGPVLLLHYQLPSGILPKVPTFCDAYANPVWPEYFHRVGKSAPYGMTTPSQPCKVKTGRPEVVHEVITANNIISPLRWVP